MLKTVGTSVEGRPIEAFVRPRKGAPTVLILGGIHGDEPKGVFLARRLIRLLETDSTVGRESRWIVVPVVNPDGYERRRRRNANRVDVNRNFPTADWERTSRRSRMYSGEQPASEPETRAVMAVVQRYRPSRIITIHSIDGHRECNNYDGPARVIALRMKRFNRYPVASSMGYPTPGSFGTWAGAERGIPTITLELPSHRSPKRCWEDNRRALLCSP
jgi:protein MpaA